MTFGGSSEPPTLREPRRPRRESLLPPRAFPSVGSGLLVGAAAASAQAIEHPLQRTAAILACVLVAWVVGYVTPPPRRRFRRDDGGRP